MQPVNNKSMVAFLFDQMEKLNNKEITFQEATAQSKLASQIVNVLNYELRRVDMEMKVNNFNKEFAKVEIRNVESKNFNS